MRVTRIVSCALRGNPRWLPTGEAVYSRTADEGFSTEATMSEKLAVSADAEAQWRQILVEGHRPLRMAHLVFRHLPSAPAFAGRNIEGALRKPRSR
jgi:hypothetical protein